MTPETPPAIRPPPDRSNPETVRFLIVCGGGRWTVRVGQVSHGPYLSQRDAFLDAVDAAHAAAELGARSEVVDRTITGREQVLWRSGVDRYPPTPPGTAGG